MTCVVLTHAVLVAYTPLLCLAPQPILNKEDEIMAFDGQVMVRLAEGHEWIATVDKREQAGYKRTVTGKCDFKVELKVRTKGVKDNRAVLPPEGDTDREHPIYLEGTYVAKSGGQT